MLESLAKGPLSEVSGVRAARHLVCGYGDRRPLDSLRAAANNPRGESVRGLAVAVLFDAGEREFALEATQSLLGSRHLASLAWGALIQVAHQKKIAEVTTELNLRRIQFGWSE